MNQDTAYPGDQTLKEFIKNSSYILETQEHTLNETTVRTKIVTPFLSVLGWNIYAEEVMVEYPIAMGSSYQHIDYALTADEDRVEVCVEAKAFKENLHMHEDQITSYMRQTGADYGLLTNGERYCLYEDVGEDRPEEDLILEEDIEGLYTMQDTLEAIAKEEFDELYGDGELTVEVSELHKFDLDVIEDGSDEKREKVRLVKNIVKKVSDMHEDDWAPVDHVVDTAKGKGLDEDEIESLLNNLKTKGEIYEPRLDRLRVSG